MVEGRRRFFLTTAKFSEIGEFFNQNLFTQRPQPVLSDVEGRLGGAISDSCFIRKARRPNIDFICAENTASL
jgi:hypothetical protein